MSLPWLDLPMGSGNNLITAIADTASIDLSVTGSTLSGVVLPAGVDHNSLANLTAGDPHTQYAFRAGVSGGQTIIGGTDPENNLAFQSTAHATKGLITIDDGSFLSISNSSAFADAGWAVYEGVAFQNSSEGADAYLVNVATGSAGVPASAQLNLAGGRGTFAAPEYLHDGEACGAINFDGSTSTTPDAYDLAYIEVTAALDQSNSNQGANMIFSIGKINSPGDYYNLYMSGFSGQVQTDMSWILNGSSDPGTVSNAVGITGKNASVSGDRTLHLRTSQAVGGAPAAADTSLKVWINGVEYYLHLTAV